MTKIREEDLTTFIEVVATRFWKNGYAVELARKLYKTGQLDESMIESAFFKAKEEGKLHQFMVDQKDKKK